MLTNPQPPRTMQALVKQHAGDGHVALRDDWPRPSPAGGEVVVQVRACGICGTDFEILHGRHKNWPPVVLGHEYTGEVVAIGADVTGWSDRDRVVCEQHTRACGRCHSCRTGAIHLCEHKRSPGWGIDGGFAEQIALPAHLLHRVPDNVTDVAAAMTEPTAICLTGIDRIQPRAGETGVVLGPGALGLLTALLLRAAGVDVIVAGRPSSQRRLAAAAQLGFETVRSDTPDPPIGLATSAGIDIVVDTSGKSEAINQGLAWLRRGGRVLELGMAESAHRVDTALAMSKAATLVFSLSSEYTTWDRALALMATGAFDPTPLARTYPLSRWTEAFDDVTARHVIKALLVPDAVDTAPRPGKRNDVD